jgi:serine/threonine-protein kinase
MCGKRWPADLIACPDDGIALHDDDTDELDVHALQTFLLPDARGWDDKPTLAAHSDTKLHVHESQAEDPVSFASDDYDDPTVWTPRKRAAATAEKVRSGGSSDPPTRIARRYDDHIDLPPGSIVDETYEIERRLGSGAMGDVYRARHLKLGKPFAIKVIGRPLSRDAGAVERFEQEARTLARLHHPNIVDVLGFGALADGRSYLVMEYLVGEVLRDRLDRGRAALHEALGVLDHIAKALEAAHAANVVHRDVKPENVFLERVTGEPRPIVKLLDFGLAKLAADVDRRTERTQSGITIGTPAYISPEQCRGANVDHRTDVYALGCVAYELLLGRGPFVDAKTVPAFFAAHLHEPPPMPRSIWPEIPPQLDLLLFATLAKDPAHRPTLAQIRAVIASVQSMPMIPAAVSSPPADRRTVALVAATIVGIVIGAAVFGSRRAPMQDMARARAAASETPIVAPLDARLEMVVAAPSMGAKHVDRPGVQGVDIATRSAPSDAGTAPTATTGSMPRDAGVASSTRPPAIGAGAPNIPTVTTAPQPEYGVLALASKPPCTVIIDGVATGHETPYVPSPLTAGKHHVTLVNAAYKIHETFDVEVTPARVERVMKDYGDRLRIDPNSTLNPFATPKGSAQ